jgi:transaldolase
VNVTLLFSRGQHLVGAEAYLRGIGRRIEAGLGPEVGSVASPFISRWDKAVMGKVPAELQTVSVCPSLEGHTRPTKIF